jgi:hypothetical protein
VAGSLYNGSLQSDLICTCVMDTLVVIDESLGMIEILFPDSTNKYCSNGTHCRLVEYYEEFIIIVDFFLLDNFIIKLIKEK